MPYFSVLGILKYDSLVGQLTTVDPTSGLSDLWKCSAAMFYWLTMMPYGSWLHTYTGLKTWDVKSSDNDNDHQVVNKLKRWGESRCRPGAATCQSCSDCSWKLVNGSGIPDLQLCLCLCRCGCLCLCDLFVFAFAFPPLALPPLSCSSTLPSRLVREPDCHIETFATRQCQQLKMTQTLGSLTNFVTPKQSGVPGESSGNGHRSYWRMQGANSASKSSSRSSSGRSNISRHSSGSRGCKVLTPASSFPTSSHKDNWNIDQTWNLGQNNEPVQV